MLQIAIPREKAVHRIADGKACTVPLALNSKGTPTEWCEDGEGGTGAGSGVTRLGEGRVGAVQA